MDILKKMDEKKEAFDALQQQIHEKEQEIIDLIEQQRVIQIENRLLLSLAKEAGLINEEGEVIS